MTARRSALLAAGLCAGAGAIVFSLWGNATMGYIATRSLFRWWGVQWVNPESENEHAWLVLALAVFMAWRNLSADRERGRPMPVAAAVAMAAALGLHAVGFVAQQARVSIVALLLFTWGLAALAGGTRWARATAFPLAFMLFAVPVNALDSLGFWLRLGVVRSSAALAHAVGIGVIRSGTQLVAPDGRYHYDVAAACSGVRSLMALSALSLFVGYLWLRSWRLRAVVFLAGFPLVFLGNLARICSVIVAARLLGQGWGDRVHDVMGFVVFVIVLVGVLALSEFLGRWDSGAGPVPAPSPSGSAGEAPLLLPAVCVVAAAVAAGVFLSHEASRPPRNDAGVLLVPGGAEPVALPAFLGSDWMGQTIEPTAVERAILPPDTGYSRKLYLSREGPGREVLLSIVLSGRDRTSIHRPELCLVGQGWTIDGSTERTVPYAGHPEASFRATVLNVHREAVVGGRHVVRPEVVAYWFVGADCVVPSQGARIARDAWNRVVHGRADRWAYVLLQTGAEDGTEAATARIESVIRDALPVFQKPVPH